MNSIINEDLVYIKDSLKSWGKFKGKNILITGANGFIPAYMVETLLFINDFYNLNLKVIALVRTKEKALARFVDYKDRDDLQCIVQDVCNDIEINEPIDFIIHAASQASPKFYGIDPIGTLSANTLGTANVLKFAEKQKNIDSVLYFSSAEVYGDISGIEHNLEETDFGPLNCMELRACYSESKRMGETMCKSWFHQKKIPTKIIRVFHTYGPGMDLSDGRVFADFVNSIVNNRDIEIKSDGKAVRAFCYLADTVVAAFKVLIDAPAGEVYNVGNEDFQTDMNELALALINLTKEKTIKVKHTVRSNDNYIDSKVNKVIPSTAKLRLLGWKPTFSIDEGFSRTIRYYK